MRGWSNFRPRRGRPCTRRPSAAPPPDRLPWRYLSQIKTRRPQPPRSPLRQSLRVAYAVQDAVVVVGDQQRTVAHHQHVDRAAPHRRIAFLVDQEALQEGRVLDDLALLIEHRA